MPEKIGKYQVLERIGRGGMGTIFKAHDPVLGRSVALKVISSEIEVTDELRARFFREAQAAARLSHPNIVTVYDMGEDNGRLFIVMELLEGEELRRLIAQRPALPLEDKLSIMVQVCAGLHYAHLKGIVHRDVKPGNIMRLHNGRVKILDFGIAQIANTEAGLTRAGLIMGTLRYISPEQARGQTDQRSDIFSVGVVFYELLSLRPPFGGENPMQLLDQLRTEEPPLLNHVDPAIPRELAAIVERAIRKDPAARFTDLEEMRLELERVQRHLAEEVKRLRVQVRGQRDHLLQLQTALAERVGPGAGEEAIPVVDDRWRLAALQALEHDFTKEIETLEARLARADLVGPALRRGNELMEAGRFADAAVEFEAVVADMPDHARALEGLTQVRAQLEAQRRRQLVAKLIDDARTALAEGVPVLCLEILEQAAGILAPAETAPEIASLRQTAEDSRLVQEAVRRAREQAERAREQMTQAQDSAQAQAAAQYAPVLWNEAEERSARADAAFAREAYTEAAQDFEGALGCYRRFEEAARQAQIHEKNAAEVALAQAMEAQEGARTADAMRCAHDRWDAAEAKVAEARAAFDMPKVVGRGAALCHEAVALYRGAEEAARTARRRERQEAEEAQDRARKGQRSAAVTDAEHLAETLWNEAAARSAGAETAFAREQYRKAAEGFVAALALYRRAEEQALEARRRQREQAEQGRPAAADRRRLALAAEAATHAAPEMSEAEARVVEGETAFARGAYVEAGQAFDEAVVLYRRAEERAREVLRALEIARADAEKASETVALARRGAAAANSSKYAGERWLAGESLEAQANAALGRREYTAARSLFIEARRQYMTAAQVAAVGREVETRRADAMVGDARRLLASGDIAGCLRRLDEVLTLRPGDAAAVELRLAAQEKLSQAKADADQTLSGLGRMAPPTDETLVLRTGLAEPNPVTSASSEAATVLSEPPTVLTERPTVFASGRESRSVTPPMSPASDSLDATRVVAEARDDTAPIGVTPRRDPPPWISAPRRANAVSMPRQRAAGPPTGRRRWSQRPGVLAAVGGALAAIAVAVFYWLVPSTAPPPRQPGSATVSPVRPPAATPTPMPAPPPAISSPPNAELPPPTEKLRDDATAAREAALLAEAERLAQQEARSLADQARTRMTAEKQRARPDAPEFNAAVLQERQGTQQYQRASFKEAGESFTAATELFAKAAARPPERPRPPAAAVEVRGVLDSYVRSFETKDLALMQKIRPGLKPAEARRMRESFDQSKAYRLSLKVDSLDVSGDEAVVKGRREDNLTSKDGQSFRHVSSFTFRLKRTGEGWIIDAIN